MDPWEKEAYKVLRETEDLEASLGPPGLQVQRVTLVSQVHPDLKEIKEIRDRQDLVDSKAPKDPLGL